MVKLYNCEKCDFTTKFKTAYDAHLLTRKHRETINYKFTCDCNKGFESNSGLWKHKRKCTFTLPTDTPIDEPLIPDASPAEIVPLEPTITDYSNTDTTLVTLINECIDKKLDEYLTKRCNVPINQQETPHRDELPVTTLVTQPPNNSELNIVDLIENNQNTKLSRTYQSKLLTRIKNQCTNNEQQLFAASFYCFLNYNQRTDFVIDLDNIWEWIGFAQKGKAKALLERHFKLDIDYILLSRMGKQEMVIDNSQNETIPDSNHGGHNKETILLTIKTFKSFCIKADTIKANEVHDYFIQMEEILHEVVNEQCTELCDQLQLVKQSNQLEKELLRERTLLEQFPKNTQCVYYGFIDDTNTDNEPLVKFGNSNDLGERVTAHKNTFSNFRLANAFRVENKFHIENAMKQHPVFIENRRSLQIGNGNQTELFNTTTITCTELDRIIREIISQIEYSPATYSRILDEFYNMKNEMNELKQSISNAHTTRLSIVE
jgi:hypothetical protein